MTHAQGIEQKYFALFAKQEKLKAYLQHGGKDIERVKEIMGE